MIRKYGDVDIPASPASAQPRYRYFEEAPERLSVPAADFLARLPAEYRCWAREASPDHRIELPSHKIFQGNTPRLRLGLLQELLPDLVSIPEGVDREQLLPLPSGWLALHFQLITRREELPPEPEQQVVETSGEPTGDQPAEESASAAVATEAPQAVVIADEKMEAAREISAEIVNPLTEPVHVVEEKRRGFFASLPIFRRREPVVAIPEVAPESVPASSVVTTEVIPPVVEIKLPQPEPPKPNSVEKEITVPLERLWKLDPSDQVADPTALQALFMTDEKLTLERIVAMAGQLPGLRACVLAHGDQVVCVSNTPAGIDLQTLSSQAAAMLSQLRESSSQMGIGAVPAITLHAEQGVLSFLYQEELCLLVLHADRGFVPGVRERLQEMLGHLATATALPEGSATQQSLPI
jgi:predicted regulator of Ras-like GTPase activity (Roadblock/LC7/MglB family)